MGHQVSGTFRVKNLAHYNAGVEAAWACNVYVRPEPNDPNQVNYLCDSDDQQKLIAAIVEVNKLPDPDVESEPSVPQ